LSQLVPIQIVNKPRISSLGEENSSWILWQPATI